MAAANDGADGARGPRPEPTGDTTRHAGRAPRQERRGDAADPLPQQVTGHRLAFYDTFGGPGLDPAKWLPYYLPHWSSRARSAPRYTLRDGGLVLRIDEDQEPWCPEYDGGIRCSSIQTGLFAGPVGGTVGQHRLRSGPVVREAQENVRLYTPTYGYFEVRAKVPSAPDAMAAFWMIGYEDVPDRSAEICIMEIFGRTVGDRHATLGYGLHPFGDPTIVDAFHQEVVAIDVTAFHRYGAHWAPGFVDFYLDGRRLRRIDQAPAYPMQFMLGIYEFPPGGARTGNGPYPKEFVVGEVRGYGRTEAHQRAERP